ncbi:MAG TPA: MFS transporter [Pirellulaceae bacterium]|nr:MFS transporter [Pirellulaceae bacterium]
MKSESKPAAINPYDSAREAAEPLAGRPPSRGSLVVIFLTVFIDLLGFGMVLPLLPVYAKSFGVDEHGWEIALLMSSFSAMTFLFSPLWGRLSDRIGRRPVLIVGLVGSVGFYLLFGVATVWRSLPLLFVARIGAGIAGATIPAAQAYIADVTTLANRAKGMAMIGAAFGLGFTFGPLLGAAALGWGAQASAAQVAASPGPGYAAAGLSALALLMAIFLLPESLRPGAHPAGHSFFDLRAWRDAFTTPSVPALLATACASVVSFAAFETTLSLLLSSEELQFRFSFRQVLLFFAFIGFMLSIAQGLLVRRLAPRVGEVPLCLAGGVVTIAGFALLIAATRGGQLWMLLVAAAVEVTGFSLMTPSLQSLISRRSDPAKQGGILGVAQSTSSLARVLGPLIAVPLFHVSPPLPYVAAIGIMALSLVIFALFARRGVDHAAGAAVEYVPEL